MYWKTTITVHVFSYFKVSLLQKPVTEKMATKVHLQYYRNVLLSVTLLLTSLILPLLTALSRPRHDEKGQIGAQAQVHVQRDLPLKTLISITRRPR